MVLPEGFAVPSAPYAIGLAVSAVLVGVLLYRLDPPFSSRTVLATTPWMGLGGALHVLHVLEIAPDVLDPLFGSPAVYVTTAVVGGGVWILGISVGAPHRALGAAGAIGLVGTAGAVLAHGVAEGSLTILEPAIGLGVAIALAAVIWIAVRYAAPDVADVMGASGVVLVFAHVLDGVSTAVGVDLLDAGERSPVPQAILEVAAGLPTAEAIGTGWLFVAVKIAVALAILWIFVPFVEDTRRQGHALVALLTAVGLGPGTHNLLLFAVAG